MTDQQGTDKPQQATEEFETREITFRDRVLLVKLPSEGQIAVLQRTLAQVERMESAPAKDGATYMRTIVRSLQIIGSVLVNQADKDWIDDLLAEDELSLSEAMEGIFIVAVEAFRAEAANREERRKATPVKRARRRAALEP